MRRCRRAGVEEECEEEGDGERGGSSGVARTDRNIVIAAGRGDEVPVFEEEEDDGRGSSATNLHKLIIKRPYN